MPSTPFMLSMASMTACLYSSVPAVRPCSSTAFQAQAIQHGRVIGQSGANMLGTDFIDLIAL